MNRNTTKLKRTHYENNEKVSTAQKRIRNENEKRRRDLFSQLINNLGDIISLKSTSSSHEQNNKLSKNAILRQVVAYFEEHRQHLANETKLFLSTKKDLSLKPNEILDFSWKPSCDIINIEEWFKITIESMNCFFLVVKVDLVDTKIVYVSENVSSYLGYSQNDIINQSLFQFILSSHHQQLYHYLKHNHQVLEKCDVSWKQSMNDDYEQCTIIGAFRQINENENHLISIVKINTLDRTLIINKESSDEQFVTHINNQGRFIFINSKTEQYLGYNSFELLGQTFFDFVHPDDLTILSQAHQLWKSNGNGQSDPYRFLTKGQQWIYLQTYSQVQNNSWTGKPEYYICTTNILQCTSQTSQKQILNHIQSNYSNIECSSFPPPPTTVSLSLNPPKEVCSSENEIKSFLSHLENDIYRKGIREKLLKLKKSKEGEIRVRQEEINVIQEILQFINQYQMTHFPTSSIDQTRNIVTEENLLNILDPNCDLTLFNSPLSGPFEDLSSELNCRDDFLSSLFSPLSTTFNFSSPITSISNSSSNNDTTQDINSSFDKTFT